MQKTYFYFRLSINKVKLSKANYKKITCFVVGKPQIRDKLEIKIVIIKAENCEVHVRYDSSGIGRFMS